MMGTVKKMVGQVRRGLEAQHLSVEISSLPSSTW
jgi:hypothetical protein